MDWEAVHTFNEEGYATTAVILTVLESSDTLYELICDKE